MSEEPRRRNTILIIILVVIVVLVLLLLGRCQPETADPDAQVGSAPATPASLPELEAVPAPAPAEEPADEVLTPATVEVPAAVNEGATFSVTWTGPDNADDYLAIARTDASNREYASYRNTREGENLELTAPIEPGEWEVRYVAGRSHTVLGRAPLNVTPIEAAIEAPDEVVMGAEVSVTWTGPNNEGDYLTIVPADAPDGKFENYTMTSAGSPLLIRAPTQAGEAEVRYMTGQSGKVIGRRPLRLVAPDISLSAPASAVAGSTIEVTWTGPDNASDYLTVVARDRPDGQYGNYNYTSVGSPLSLLTPIEAGEAEIRYMSGQGAKVLARRPITLESISVTLSAPEEVAVGAEIEVTWTGPNYPRDYITVVPPDLPDGQYRNYRDASAGSPLTVKAPDVAGDYELRYVTGQGAKVIARQPIRVTP